MTTRTASGVVCTIFDESYRSQFAALVNSLCQNDYNGVIWVGFQGSLPRWCRKASNHDDFSELIVAPGCTLRFLRANESELLKVNFMLSIAEKYCSDNDALFYFDPDVVIDARWSLFEEWVSYGIAAIAVREYSHSTDRGRNYWTECYEQLGFSKRNQFDFCIDDSFLAIRCDARNFLKEWKTLHQKVAALSRTSPAPALHQNYINLRYSLTAALEITDLPTTLMGSYCSVLDPPIPVLYCDTGIGKERSSAAAPATPRQLSALVRFLAYTDWPVPAYPTPIKQILNLFFHNLKQGRPKVR